MVSKEQIEASVYEWIKKSDAFMVEVKVAPSKVVVYIDKPEGITLNDCASLNKWLMSEFENDPVWETHELEVSSPGMDQPLRVPQQYLRRIGREVRLLMNNGKVLKGRLTAANDSGIEIAETASNRERKNGAPAETLRKFDYEELKETKLVISFKK
jgi:ribosome maturation factor RimP